MCPKPSGDASQLLRLVCLTPHKREISVSEQRYQAVLAVIVEGAVMEVASQWGMSRRTVHRWLAHYEKGSGGRQISALMGSQP
jgi:transposase